MATEEDLQETVRLLEKTGQRIVAKVADVRDRVGLQAAIDEGVAELGKLDVVIANAGISPIGAGRPIINFTETVDINLNGAINTVHASMQHLGEGASIIMIGSAAGLIPGYGDTGPAGPGGPGGPGGAAYSFAKQTLVQYVNAFAVQLAPTSRRINAVHPTNCNTPLLQSQPMYETFRPDLENPTREDAEPAFATFQAMPIPYVESSDVSHAVTYLASDESRYVTALHLKVDGGALVQRGL